MSCVSSELTTAIDLSSAGEAGLSIDAAGVLVVKADGSVLRNGAIAQLHDIADGGVSGDVVGVWIS